MRSIITVVGTLFLTGCTSTPPTSITDPMPQEIRHLPWHIDASRPLIFYKEFRGPSGENTRITTEQDRPNRPSVYEVARSCYAFSRTNMYFLFEYGATEGLYIPCEGAMHRRDTGTVPDDIGTPPEVLLPKK